MQKFFNDNILKHEQELYRREGLNVPEIQFTDNQDIIELIESKSNGIFTLLDEESKLPKPSFDHFTLEVHKAWNGHFRLSLPRASRLKAHRTLRDEEGFLVRHFAGAVCYNTVSTIEIKYFARISRRKKNGKKISFQSVSLAFLNTESIY